MGDRAVLRFMLHDADGSTRALHLYTHWAGRSLPSTLQRALRVTQSEEELVGVCLALMQANLGPVDGRHRVQVELGVTYPDWPLLIVDASDQDGTVSAQDEDTGQRLASWSFADYLNVDFSNEDPAACGGWEVLIPGELARRHRLASESVLPGSADATEIRSRLGDETPRIARLARELGRTPRDMPEGLPDDDRP